MKQSTRKRISITKLTVARIKYIREHFYQFVAHQLKKRQDIVNAESIGKDTMIIEVGVELLFNAICKMENLSPTETDKLAIAEYSNQQTASDEYLDKLTDFVELEYHAKQSDSVTLEDRKKAVEEYKKKTQEISEEWGEES